MAGLNFAFTADNQNFMNSLNQVTQGVQNASRQIQAEGGNIEAVFTKLKQGVAMLGIGTGLKELVGQVFSIRDEFQKLEITFNTLLGSKEKADALMDQLIKTAAITPFDMRSVTEGAKSLLAYGVAAEDVNQTLIGLGDIAAGLKIPLTDLTYLYGTTIVQGRMFTQDLRQFQGRGIPIAEELANVLGKPKEKIGELVTAGQVTSEVFIQAMKNMTAEGSKFGGLMEAQSKSLGGQWENIKDSIEQMFNEIGKSSQGILNTSLGLVSNIVENWQSVLLVLGDVAVAYGVEKAIMLGASAVATSSYQAEIKALSELIPAKEQSTNLDIAEAVAKGKITEATAAKVIAMRSEVESYIESLRVNKAAATAEAKAAAEKYRAALQQSIAAKAAVQAKREELIASGEICGAYISENAIKEMSVVTDNAKQASLQSVAAKQVYNAAVTKKKIAAEALDIATTQADTVAQNVNARSTNILTVAKEFLTKTTKKLYATMAAHPYALLLGVVLALGYGIYKLCTYQSDAEIYANKSKEASAKCSEEYGKEKKNLDDLKKSLESSKRGSEEWKKAKDSIVAQYGQYFKKLDEEIQRTGTLATSYNSLTKAIKSSMIARAMDKYDKDNEIDFSDTQADLSKAIKGKITYYDSQDGYKKKKIVLSENMRQKLLDAFARYQAGEEVTFTPLVKDILVSIDNRFGNNMMKKGLKNHQKSIEKEQGGIEIAKSFGYSEKDAKELWASRADASSIKADMPERNLEEVYKEASNNYQKAKAEVEKMKKNRSAYTDKQWEAAQNELKAAKQAYEDAGGDTKQKKTTGLTSEQIASNEKKAASKIAELKRKQEEELLRIDEEFEFKRWQNRIDVMDEGEAKVLAQMQLDQQKEISALDDQKRDAINAEIERQRAIFDAVEDEKAAGNKKYVKEIFNSGSGDIEKTTHQLQGLELMIKSASSELDNLVKEPIKNESAIADLTKQINEWQKQYEELVRSLGDVDISNIKHVLSRYDEMFKMLLSKQSVEDKNHSEQVKKDLNELLEQYGTYEQQAAAILERGEKRKEEIFKKYDLTDAQKKQISDKIDTETNWNLFQKSGEYLKFFNSTLSMTKKEVVKIGNKIKEKLDKNLQDGVMSAEDYYNELEKIDALLKKSEERLSSFGSFMQGGLDGLLSNNLEQKQSDYQNALSNQQKAIEDRKNIESQIAEFQKKGDTASANGLQDKLKGAQAAEQAAASEVEGAAAAQQGAEGAMSAVSMIDMIVHGINDMVQGIYDTFLQIQDLADSLGTDTSADTDWGKAGAFLQAFSQASDGATKAWDSLKSGNPGGVISGVAQSLLSWFTVFNRWHDAKLQKQIERSQEIVENIQYAYDAIERRLKNSSFDISEVFNLDSMKAELDSLDQTIKDKEEKLAKMSGAVATGTIAGNIAGGLLGGIAGAIVGQTAGGIADAVNRNKRKKLEKQINELYKEREKLAARIQAYETGGVYGLQRQLLKEQLDEKKKQLEEEQSKKKSDNKTISKLNDEIDELSVKIRQFAEDTAKELYDIDLNQWAENLSDAITEAFIQGEDAVEAFDEAASDMLRNVVKKMINLAVIKPKIEALRKYLFGEDGEGGAFGINMNLSEQDVIGMKPFIEGLKDSVSEAEDLFNVINSGLGGMLEDADAINEKLTDISFDSVRDNFKSLLADMESTSADFSDNFTEMLRNALIEGLMSAKYDKMLKEWYEEFAEKMNDQQLTDSERDYLRQKYQEIVDSGIADRNAINEIVGQGAFAQSSSQGGFSTMSQDTADELNGRFTALVELQATSNMLLSENNAFSRDILLALQSFANLSQVASGESPTLIALKDMMFLSTSYLEDIAKHSKKLTTIDNGISELRKTISEKL